MSPGYPAVASAEKVIRFSPGWSISTAAEPATGWLGCIPPGQKRIPPGPSAVSACIESSRTGSVTVWPLTCTAG